MFRWFGPSLKSVKQIHLDSRQQVSNLKYPSEPNLLNIFVRIYMDRLKFELFFPTTHTFAVSI